MTIADIDEVSQLLVTLLGHGLHKKQTRNLDFDDHSMIRKALLQQLSSLLMLIVVVISDPRIQDAGRTVDQLLVQVL